MKPKRTQYSDHFDIFKEKATCRKCGAVISCVGRSTSGMKYHLEKVHEINLSDLAAESTEKKMKTTTTPSASSFFKAKKPPLEELVSKSATKRVSFEFLATDDLIRGGIERHGYKAPKSHNTIRNLVRKSAQNHRKIYRDKFQALKKEGQRFCVVADEWTCSSKKRKYLNVILHLKGKEIILLSTRHCLVDNSMFEIMLDTIQCMVSSTLN